MVFEGLIESLFDLGRSIAEYIGHGIFILVHCFFYPFQVIFYWFSIILKLIWNTFVNLLTAWWDIFNVLYDFLSDMLTSLFPSMWSVIILLGITIVFTLRLYYFIKDISIVGNKI